MSGEADETGAAGTQRLDKWLWFTRLVKSRTLAAGLISDGKVRLNRQRIAKPSQTVKSGDVVTAAINRRVHVVKVVSLGERRGPATEARLLYEDLSEPVVPGSPEAGSPEAGGGPRSARPNKRERREITALKRGGSS